MFTQRGISTGLIVGIVAVLLLIGGGYYATSSNNTATTTEGEKEAMVAGEEGAAMEKKDGEAMEATHNGDAMMEKDGDAMKKMDGGTMMSDDEHSMMMEKKDGDAMTKEETSFRGAVIAGSSAPLLEYNQRDYESALAQGRVVVLYFYANWCPLCKKEFIDTKAAFNAYEGDDIVGFRVHFNDGDVTPEMEARAREFGVAYQHTKVLIKDGKRVLKSPETWGTERYLSEFANITN